MIQAYFVTARELPYLFMDGFLAKISEIVSTSGEKCYFMQGENEPTQGEQPYNEPPKTWKTQKNHL